jgi:hypothetical protein
MTPVPPIPIERYLVPATSETPPELQTVDQPLVAGLPATIPLTKELSLVLALPTGLAQSLRELDANVVVSEDTGERRPYQPGGAAIGSTERAPARLFLLRNGVVTGSAPLVAGVRRRLPEDGDESQGTVVELVVLSWRILAGTVLGVGDYGSQISFAWREVDRAADLFLPPPIDPNVISRLRDRRQTQSLLGAGVQRAPSGYETAGTGSSDRRKDPHRHYKRPAKKLKDERFLDRKREQISERAFAPQELL